MNMPVCLQEKSKKCDEREIREEEGEGEGEDVGQRKEMEEAAKGGRKKRGRKERCKYGGLGWRRKGEKGGRERRRRRSERRTNSWASATESLNES